MDCSHEVSNFYKRRRIGDNDVSQGKAYDSGDDSGASLFESRPYETIATLPLQKEAASTTTQASYVTQPTQIISNDTPTAVIQVPGSSPAKYDIPRPLPTKSPTRNRGHAGGILASAMAPPGTAFRAPQGVSKAPTSSFAATRQIIDISDSDEDLPKYQGASSDEDTQTARRADIKPSSFISSAQQSAPVGSIDKSKTSLANSFYRPGDLATKPDQILLLRLY